MGLSRGPDGVPTIYSPIDFSMADLTPGVWRITVKGVIGKDKTPWTSEPHSSAWLRRPPPANRISIRKPPASPSTPDAMLELTADNAADYLRRKGWIGPGPVEVEALGGGVSNAVLRVRTPERVFVLKQSRPQLRTRDAWFSDLDRVYREQEVMQASCIRCCRRRRSPKCCSAIATSTSSPCPAPRTAHGRGRRCCWPVTSTSTSASAPAPSSAACTKPRPASRTSSTPSAIGPSSCSCASIRSIAASRSAGRRSPHAVAPLIDGMLASQEALCHGDYSPKNILTHEHGFTLVDYETAHLGDPTMDLGFFLSHCCSRRRDGRPTGDAIST